MADVSKINLYGTDYLIKDTKARQVANNAATSASEAKTAAGNAQTTADNAATSASEAKTAADNAQNTADHAATSANEAKTAAGNAQSTANNAVSKATTNSTNITKLSTEGVVISYESKDESIKVTKGISLK